jgi:arylsulfatase A-like enzyme
MFGIPWWISLTQDRYKYVRCLVENSLEEFYDLDSDPDELRNLAIEPEHASLLADYRERMVCELRRTGAELVENMPEPRTILQLHKKMTALPSD